MQGTIVFISAFYNRTGLAGSAKAWVKTLHDNGFRIKIISVNDVQPGVDDFDMELFKSLENTRLVPPITAIFFHNPTQDWLDIELPDPHVRIMLTGFVGSNVPPEWIDLCNKMDHFCVMSDTERMNWINSGAITEKLSTLPGPHSWLNLPILPVTTIRPKHSDRIFRFLSLGTFSPNRRWDSLIEAFFQEFRDNDKVELYLRVNYPAWHPVQDGPKKDLENLIGSLRQKTNSKAKIVVDETLGTRLGIMELIDSADIYVSTDVAATATLIESICRRVPVILVEKVWKDSKKILEYSIPIKSGSKQESITVKGEMLKYLPQYDGVEWPRLSIREIRKALQKSYAMDESDLSAMSKQSDIQNFKHASEENYVARMTGVIKKAWSHKNQTIFYGNTRQDRNILRIIGPGVNALEKLEYESAIDVFSKVIQNNPELIVAKQLYCDAFMGNEKTEKAIHYLKQYFTENPTNVDFACQLGMFYMVLQDWTEAERYINKALKIDDSYLPLLITNTSLFYETGRFAEALEWNLKAIKSAPMNSDLRALSGLIMLALGNMDGAVETLQKLPWEASYDRPLVRRLIDDIIASDPDALPTKDIFNIAYSRYCEQAYEDALKFSEIIIQRDLDDDIVGDVFYYLGIYHLELEQKDEAKDIFETGLIRAPEHKRLQLKIISEYANKNELKKALSILKIVLKKNPKDIEYLLMRGNCQLESQDPEAAYDTFREVHLLAPRTVGLPQAINKLAEITGREKVKINKVQEETKTMKTESVYTKDLLHEYVTKLGFDIGDYSYGGPVIRWWGEDAKLSIGRYCSIAANVKIYLGGNHRHDWVTSYPFPSSPMNENWPNVSNRGLPTLPATNGDVRIGHDVWIGDDVSIFSGITVGDGVVIAAKSVVTKDIPPYAIVGGHPAKIISYRFPEDVVKEMMEIKWWNWAPEKVNEYVPLLCSPNLQAFIKAVRDNNPPKLKAALSAKDEPAFTGERAMPLAHNMDEAIMVEHWARYKYAAPKIKGLRVLDIACGAGYGSDLLADHAKSVVGGDIDPDTVEYCKSNYKKDNLDYQVMDIRNIPFPDNSFDAIVSFETIEHVEEWEKFLMEINRLVVEDGQLIISTPLGGECGNHFHLSYFQRSDFKKYLKKYFQDVDVVYQRVDKFHKDSISPLVAETFTGEYALAMCKNPIKTARPKVSIVMLTFNALDYTKKCVDSIVENTSYPYEIIFVDNASSDGTVAYLQKLVKKHKNFKLVKNKENKGFAAGNNRGVEVATGDYVLLLNNDVLVADSWLETLVEALELDENIGMVGPITNFISGRQMIADVPYKDDTGFFAYAGAVAVKHRNIVTPRRRIAGFAVLMKRDLYLEVDGLDESFGIGNFEDDDLCLKIKQAGYAIMVHEGVFIHHFGSQTFKANKMNYEQSLAEKGKQFKQKWPDVDYEELLELKNPLSEYHPAMYQTGMNQLEYGEHDAAYKTFKQLLLDNPCYEDAMLAFAMSARSIGKTEECLSAIQKLLTINPGNALAYNLSGLISAEAGNLEAAKKLFKSAMDKDPNLLDPQRNYAEILLMGDEFQGGVQILMDILKQNPEDITTLLRLAELNLEAGRNEDASALAKAVLDLDPGQAQATQILENMET